MEGGREREKRREVHILSEEWDVINWPVYYPVIGLDFRIPTLTSLPLTHEP